MEEFKLHIEEYMGKSTIFKNDMSYLLQAILVISEKRVRGVELKKTAESDIHRELDIINTAIKMAFRYGTDSVRKDPDILKKVEGYLDNVDIYNTISNLLSLSYKGKVNFYKDRDDVKLVYNKDQNINKDLEILNFYNKLNYNQLRNKELSKKWINGNETHLEVKEIYNKFKKIYLDVYTEFEINIEFKDFNLYEIYDVIMAIYIIGDMLRYITNIRKDFDLYNPIYMDCEKLIYKVQELTELTYIKVKLILEFITYNKEDRLDIICTPLLKVKDIQGVESYLISNALIKYSDIERNMLVLLQSKEEKEMKNSMYKEETLIRNIKKEISKYDNIKYSFNKNIFKECKKERLTEIDMALYDEKNKMILVCELKNFNRADTVAEHINVQGMRENQGLNKAFEQLNKIKNYYYSNTEEFIKKCFGKIDVLNEINVCFLIISRNNLGSYVKNDIKVIDEINFYDLLENNKGNLFGVANDLKNNTIMPQYGVDYIEQMKEIDFAGYKIFYSEYKVLHREYV